MPFALRGAGPREGLCENPRAGLLSGLPAGLLKVRVRELLLYVRLSIQIKIEWVKIATNFRRQFQKTNVLDSK